MKERFTLRVAILVALAALCATASYAAGHCPVSHQPLPSAAQRQFLPPVKLLGCFMTPEEINTVRSAIGHDAQVTATDPAFESGELNPDGSMRPPLTASQFAALIKMHSVLAEDMRNGAVIRKFIQNSDIGGFLYGRTVIGSPSAPIVVTTNTVRGFVGLERNTQGLDAGATVGALGLDFETTPLGQYTDATADPLLRQVSLEIRTHGLHSIRHIMVTQGASDAKIPLGKDLNDTVQASAPTLIGRSFEMNRQGQTNPYTALGISHNLFLLTLDPSDPPTATYPLHLNEEDVMTVPTPLAVGDVLFRRKTNGQETPIARYIRGHNPDGTVTNRWFLSQSLSAADKAYYRGLLQQAAARVAAAGG
ncbi:MAG TPA: hypothetical protein VGS07_10360 [Thermoanaerobaculia bacterium]|jgi:hypothetical protein|nr:hypothetical protein [Thermoanaerobaculia bacterium]